MADARRDPFNAIATLDTPLGKRRIAKLESLNGIGDIGRLPYSIRVLLEACLRNFDDYIVTRESIEAIARYDARKVGDVEIPYARPGRAPGFHRRACRG